MTVDLQEKMSELTALQESFIMESQAFPGREGRCIINPGEIPWWMIEDPKEKWKVNKRQRLRMWRKIHPGYFTEAQKRYTERHPEAGREAERRYQERYPGRRAEIMKRSHEKQREQLAEANRKHCLTHVGTPSTSGGTLYLFAPYKRKQPNNCELCESQPKVKGWHHWDNRNPSMGLWTCFSCNCFAGAVDAGGWELVKKYASLKELLDEQYADGKIVELSKQTVQLSYQEPFVGTTINGIRARYRAWGKRSRPSDNLCELCSASKCYNYHHWDNDILGKGFWVCRKCHCFAERFDVYGEAFVEKYLSLKEQDGLRVSLLIGANSKGAEQHD